MAEGPSPSAAERSAAAYKRLASSALTLNLVSDNFGKPIATIEDALRRLNIGVEAWERVRGSDGDPQGEFWSEHIGFAKVTGEWCIALRRTDGHHAFPGEESQEFWNFRDAPRSTRIAAVDQLPDLIDKLVKAAEKTAKRMQEKLPEVEALAQAVTAAANEVAPRKSGRRS